MIPAALVQTVRELEVRARAATRSTDVMCVFVDAGVAWTIGADGSPRAVPPQVWPVVSQVAATGRRTFLGRALIEPIGAMPVRAVLVLRRPWSAGLYGAHEAAALGAISNDVAIELRCLLAMVPPPVFPAVEDRTLVVERAAPRDTPLEPVLFGIALKLAILVTALVIVLGLYRLSLHLA